MMMMMMMIPNCCIQLERFEHGAGLGVLQKIELWRAPPLGKCWIDP